MSGDQGGTILIVDDEDDLRTALREVIADEGYTVAEAADGQQALDYLRSHPVPCVVLLDLMMPRMSGGELLARMKQDPALRDVPVVVLSAAAVARMQELVTAFGLPAYLPKPLHVEAVLRQLERFC